MLLLSVYLINNDGYDTPKKKWTGPKDIKYTHTAPFQANG